MIMATPQAKRAIAQAACVCLREVDKVSFSGSGVPEYDRLRRTILETIYACGYDVMGSPWRLVKKED
jgi:hypothetical protein